MKKKMKRPYVLDHKKTGNDHDKISKWLDERLYGDIIVFDPDKYREEDLISLAGHLGLVLDKIAPGRLEVTGVEGGLSVIEHEQDNVLARKRVSHPSYAMIDINRSVSGADDEFFGSCVPHRGGVSITIHTGEMVRRTLYDEEPNTGRKTIIKLKMAPDQFAMLIGGLGDSRGIPATIERLNGKRVKFQPPFDHDLKSQVDRGISEALGDAVRKVKEAEAKIEAILDKKSITMGDREEIRKIHYHMIRLLTDSLPFLADQIQNAATHMARAAQSEIENRIRGAVERLGKSELGRQLAGDIGKTEDILPGLDRMIDAEK